MAHASVFYLGIKLSVHMTLTSTHYRKLMQFLWMSSIAAEYNVELFVSEHVSDWCCYVY